MKPVSVSQLNSYINNILKTDPILGGITVKGEVSKLTKHSSGHWYFTLKDETSKVPCFMSSDRVAMLRYELSEGMEIIASGNISVFEKGGYYSLNIKDVDVEGEGALKIAYENLKNKLEKEGLFDLNHKRPIPRFPKKIGIVTSPTGAAIHDILTTLKRRNPFVDVIIFPCLVQGSNSAESICQGIELLNKKYPDIEVLIVGRGGGSAEDLWSFNEESVVRAIFNSKIPVISAVGHEIDFTLSDFSADLRAATPTAAAELAAIDIANYRNILENNHPKRLFAMLETSILDRENRLKFAKKNLDFAFNSYLNGLYYKLYSIKSVLDGNSPLEALNRGYSIVLDSHGNHLSSCEKLRSGELIKIKFKDGEISAVVQNIFR